MYQSFYVDTCFVFRKRLVSFTLKITSYIQKHRSITLTWGCLCGEDVHFYAQRVCRLCVSFQRINGFEAVYASGVVCGVTHDFLSICTKGNVLRLCAYMYILKTYKCILEKRSVISGSFLRMSFSVSVKDLCWSS